MFPYRNALKVLDAVICLCNGSEDKSIEIENLVSYLDDEEDELDLESTLKYLEKNEYLKVNHIGVYNFYSDSGFSSTSICLTHEGKHYKEIRIQRIKEFFMESILTPIIIAAITAWITTLITNALTTK